MLIFLVAVMPLMMFAALFGRIGNANGAQALYSQNRDGWRIVERISHFPQNDGWFPGEKLVYHYRDTVTTRPDSVKLWVNYEDTRVWIENMRTDYTYDNQGYVTFAEGSYIWDGWSFPYMRIYPHYDNQHRLIHLYVNMVDVPVGNREEFPMVRMHLVYEPNGEYTVYNWEQGWEDRPQTWGKVNFQWDAQGRIIEEIESTSPDSLNWSLARKTVHTYHAADVTTGADVIYWVSMFLPMMFTNGDDMEMPGLRTEMMHYDWMDEWVVSDRDVMTYTSSAPYLLLQGQNDHWGDGEWVANDKWVYTYDENNNPASMTNLYWDNGIYAWMANGMDTFTWERWTSYLDDPAIPPANASNLRAYPNPFSGVLNLALDSKSSSPVHYEVYNTRGQLVRSFVVLDALNAVWDGRDMTNKSVAAGIYLIRATQDNRHKQIKVLRIK